MRSGSFYAAYIIKKLWTCAAILLVLVAVAISVVRYTLPYMDGQKHRLEQWVEGQYGVEINIGTITAQWKGAGPAIVLEDLQLVQNAQSPLSLDIKKTIIELDFWGSILGRQIRSQRFDLNGLNVKIDVTLMNKEGSDFPVVSALKQLFLEQLQSFSVSDSQFEISTAHDQQVVLVNQLLWSNRGLHHQGVGELQVEELASNSASFTLDLRGDKDSLNGTFYARAHEVDLSPWINQWLATRYDLIESRGNFVVWASIQDGDIKNAQLDLADSRFVWQNEDAEITAAILGGQLNAEPSNDGWIFNLYDLALQANERTQTSNWYGEINNQGQVHIQNADRVDLSAITPLLPLVLNPVDFNLLNDLAPNATLNKFNVKFDKLDTYAQVNLSQIGWQQSNSIPGVDNLELDINWHNDKGRVQIRGRNSQWKLDNIVDRNIEFQRVDLDMYIQSLDEGIAIYAPKLQLGNDWLNIDQHLRYESNTGYLALNGTIGGLDIAQVNELFPSAAMGKETKAYLQRALKGGHVNGAKILWNGELGQFPYANNQGVFQITVGVEDASFEFAPDWPQLNDLNIDLLFENKGLFMQASTGKLLGVNLSGLSADIPDLDVGAVLTIDAKGSALGTQVNELMKRSSLASSLGKVLDEVQVSDALNVDLNLVIPLSGQDVVASGVVHLADNRVYVPRVDINLTHAKGQVSFKNEVVDMSGLQAQLFSQPVKVDFSGRQRKEGYLANIDLQGDWKVKPLIKQFVPSLASYVDGKSPWQANVKLTLPEDGFSYQASVYSGLQGIGSQLPEPLNKTVNQNKPLTLDISGDETASTVNLKMGSQVNFDGVLPYETMQFSRAHLAIGESLDMPMGLGFSVAMNLPYVNIDNWYHAISSLLHDLTGNESGIASDPNKKPFIGEPQRIFLNADSATVASQQLTDLEAVTKNSNDSWQIIVNAKQVRANVSLYKDWLARGINISADYLDLAGWEKNEGKAVEFEPKLETLPPVEFLCERCRFEDKDLGRVDFKLSRAANGMHIDSLRLNNDHGLFYASGDWLFTPSGNQTKIEGEFSSSDFGLFLKGFEFDSGIKDSKASAKFNLDWQRAPFEFDFATLNGHIDWRLSDGYLTEVTDKGSRIFSLLSLESLVRKLRLDFRDVFAQGFFYDKMKGSFQVAQGTVDTRDTVVDGGAGEITMQGYTNLNTREVNYNIAFAPKVTSSLPLIVAYMVNPATALAALALDQVLTSAKVISNIKFSLTGTLDDPKLEELERDSKEIRLPAQTAPAPVDTPNVGLAIDPNGHNTDISIPQEIDQERVALEVSDG
ncbi:YhdP family protein [Paraglaciecola mesophila]|uniref:YhdP family protein n=1 Tax=Paraglaciecola mesophila TaxID=197222 RepID=A0ABU9SXL6_9ALTE